ncbi:MAG: ABC transporter substrate-binding protein [Propionibacteriaceae bacterium]|nr:ABC transporter substrate-binding protein [Propionibacteriaceae bacterium]
MRRPLAPSRLLAALFAVLALLVTCACSPVGAHASGSATPAPGTITVGLTYQPDIQFAPFYVADSQGWFAQAGLHVTLRHHGSSETLFGAFQAGTEQVVFAGGDEMMQARAQGVDITDFATIYQTYPVVLIVPASSSIHTLADLRGRSIGIPGPYGENWFALQVMLASANLTQADVHIVNIGYTQQAALTAKRVDAVVGFSNNDVINFQQAGFPVRQLTTPTPMPLIGSGLGASPTLLGAHPAQLTTFLSVVRRGVQYCIDHPQDAVRLSARYVPGLSDSAQRTRALATLTATIPLYGTGDQIGRQDAALWAQMSQFMQQQGLLATPVPAAQAFTSAIAGSHQA